MRFCSLGSGSTGNAWLVESGATRVLIDIILSIYDTLSSNTLQLMREIAGTHGPATMVARGGRAAEQEPTDPGR